MTLGGIVSSTTSMVKPDILSPQQIASDAASTETKPFSFALGGLAATPEPKTDILSPQQIASDAASTETKPFSFALGGLAAQSHVLTQSQVNDDAHPLEPHHFDIALGGIAPTPPNTSSVSDTHALSGNFDLHSFEFSLSRLIQESASSQGATHDAMISELDAKQSLLQDEIARQMARLETRLLAHIDARFDRLEQSVSALLARLSDHS